MVSIGKYKAEGIYLQIIKKNDNFI